MATYVAVKYMAYNEENMLYDTRCYFNVRSKADISQLNLLPSSLSFIHYVCMHVFIYFGLKKIIIIQTYDTLDK